MKITIGPISLDILLFFRLWWPAVVFTELCMGIFSAFISCLGTITLTYNAPLFVGGAWLSLLLLYTILGIAFTYFVARRIRDAFGSEERRIQRRMALLSGFPFYTLCLICLMTGLLAGLFYPDSPDICGSIVFASLLGFLGFGLVSCSYWLLLRFFLRGSRGSTAMAQR